MSETEAKPLESTHPAIKLHEDVTEKLRLATGLLYAAWVQGKAGVPMQSDLLADVGKFVNG